MTYITCDNILIITYVTPHYLIFISRWVNKEIGTNKKIKLAPTFVTTLTTDNFDKHVLGKKAALVEFYAPWCGHCKKLSPIYDELALKLKTSNPNIIIAKMDSTTNEVAEVSIQGFPTLKFWPKGNKSTPMDYSGDRDLNGFMAFLEKNASGFVKEEL